MTGFSTQQIPDLTGKVCIVTGANTGIGRVTALELARKNAHVILACRSQERTAPVVESIKSETKNDKVEFMPLDLGSLRSVSEFCDAFLKRGLPLHILVNNAGIMALPNLELSVDGIELQLATNHFGHFHLTQKLLPVIEKSAPSRIVCLSSKAHEMAPAAGIEFDHFNNPKKYSSWTWYGQSKLANLLFARELSKRLEERGVKDVYVNAVHPGVVRTELARNMGWYFRLPWALFQWFLMSPEDGALTQLYCAASPDIETEGLKGRYFVPIAQLHETSELGRNDELAKKLWDWTDAMIKEKLSAKK